MKTIVLFLLITAPLYSQSSGIENLDSKYGFNKFRLEEPINKYSGEIKYNGKRDLDNVDLYIYNGPSIGKVFGYFNAKAIYLEFYKNKLFEIRIDFGTITKANCEYIYNELIKLFGYQQRKLNSDEYVDLGYFWMGEKTSLLFMKYKDSNTIIRIISDKVQTSINNDKF